MAGSRRSQEADPEDFGKAQDGHDADEGQAAEAGQDGEFMAASPMAIPGSTQEKGELADEPVEQRRPQIASEPMRKNAEVQGGRGQPAQAIDIPRMGFPIDDSGSVEQEALEREMVENVQDRSEESEKGDGLLVAARPSIPNPMPIPMMPIFSMLW